MKTSDFDYHLPEALIAQEPTARRDESRLLVVDRTSRTIAHRRFAELPEFLRAGDTLIRNTVRVLPARLFGTRETGGKVECLLLRPADAKNSRSEDRPSGADSRDGERWWCLLRPGRKLPPGSEFSAKDAFQARVIAKSESAEYLVGIHPTRSAETVAMLAERIGTVPLPPYIRRTDADAGDRERYQTVFADREHTVAVAAPTAGLHFTGDLLKRVREMRVGFVDLVLHVGLGTFKPIETVEVSDHRIHREIIEIPPEAQRLIRTSSDGRRVAVGTTSVRAMEHFARQDPARTTPGETHVGEATLFIHPPFSFRVTDALITNFHLPRSTLLCLVASFLTPGSTEGVKWLRDVYEEAIRERYRFLSYGDAMLIV